MNADHLPLVALALTAFAFNSLFALLTMREHSKHLAAHDAWIKAHEADREQVRSERERLLREIGALSAAFGKNGVTENWPKAKDLDFSAFGLGVEP